LTRAYAAEKARCRELYPDNSHAYADCKADWIRRMEAEAIYFYHVGR
jgi:hypothetical protein